MRKMAVLGSVAVLLAFPVWRNAIRGDDSSHPVKKETTLQSLKADVEALKPAKIAWREIQWKSCLLDGLEASRESKKPILLWVFIDRPADDARC
ncbi:MAG TPA: hypothetical protein VGH74_14305 [Planctomycetaceae bacterium]|jgi:hypothetical protein